jgi:hypothetical protein
MTQKKKSKEKETMREYGHMDILIWALASIGLDIVKWDQGTIIGKHTSIRSCMNFLGIFIYVNIFNAFFLVKTIYEDKHETRGRNTKFIQISSLCRRPPKLEHSDWDWKKTC